MTEMETVSIKLFVYGSWAQGFVHFEKIKALVSSIVPATIVGQAYRLPAGYPVVAEIGEDLIEGEVLTLPVSEFLVNLLDEFHGFNKIEESKSLFFRRKIRAVTEAGEESVWTYFVNPAKMPKKSSAIAGGKWRDSIRELPPLPEKLTERQRTYIQRLGQSTGREIVPIDLPLYRELMNLELIVDKGRRLALSKTGNEVFKYLS